MKESVIQNSPESCNPVSASERRAGLRLKGAVHAVQFGARVAIAHHLYYQTPERITENTDGIIRQMEDNGSWRARRARGQLHFFLVILVLCATITAARWRSLCAASRSS